MVTVEFWKPYFENEYPELDGFPMLAEHAAAWTLLHPEYTVVVPKPDPGKAPWALVLATGNVALTRLVDEWVIFARDTGVQAAAFHYRIRGHGAVGKNPRWSIMRDVLGWEW